MKKMLALLLALIMCVSLFAGCAAKQEPEPSAPAEESTPVKEEPAPKEEEPPVEEEPMKITWLPATTPGYTPVQDTETELKIEERYNVDITVEEIDATDPEIFDLYWSTGGEATFSVHNKTMVDAWKMVDDGMVRGFPIEWMEEYMPNWLAATVEIMGSKEAVYDQIARDGEVYLIPYANASDNGYIMAIRQDWLDNLGLEMPTTAEEMEAVLHAFTYDDPDGNGANDTFGMHGGHTNNWMKFGYMMSQFNTWPACFWNVDGKVIFTDTTDAYKDMLTYLASLYADGVVDPEFVTDDRAAMRAKWAAGKFGVIVDHPSWLTGEGNIINMVTDVDPNAEIVVVPTFASVGGGTPAVSAKYPSCANSGAFFGTSATDEQVIKILQILEDYYTDQEFYWEIRMGIEGENWTYDENGARVYTEAMTSEVIHGIGLGALPGAPIPQTVAWINENNMMFGATLDGFNNCADCEKLYIPTNFVQGANEAYDLYYSDIKTLSDEFYYGSITGRIDIEAEWDAYQESLDKAGLQDVIDGYQALIDG